MRIMRLPKVRHALALLGVVAGAAAGVACHGGGHFTVTSTSDAGDTSPGNGTCQSTASGGACTLRAALQEANAKAGRDIIGFNIPGDGPHRIEPATQLPFITDTAGVTIDGYTEPDSAANTSDTASNAILQIEVRGNGPTDIDGFKLQSPGNVIRGLAVWDFERQFHLFVGNADGNEILGNFIGTDAAGTAGATARNTASQGIVVQGGASGNRIGRPGNGNRNVISGNYGNGVGMYDNGTTGNLVQNNLIGLRPGGTAGLRNWNHGVDLNTGAANNLVGGPNAGEGNVISGNGASGVEVSHGAATLGNDVVDNLIGTTSTGGSTSSSLRNPQYGVFLEGLASCTTSCPDDAGDSTVEGNVIVNANGGIAVQKGRHGDVIRDNRIGVLEGGANAGHTLFGVRIEKGSHDTTVGPGNVITANPEGVEIQATGSNPTNSTEVPTFDNRITENRIFGNGGTTGIGIDLAPYGAGGVSPSTFVNHGIRVPTLTLSGTNIRATAAGCSGCTIELFVADTTSTTAFGEGRDFVASGVTNTSGVVDFPQGPVDGRVVTATVTDTSGDSSEFARNVSVP
jgi:CSLREA domain-containing protein